jgi:hypothetical protein
VNYNFTPNVIKVKKGDQVKLVITARDRDHGFKLAAFHIDQRFKGRSCYSRIHCGSGRNFPVSVFSLLRIGPQENEWPANR